MTVDTAGLVYLAVGLATLAAALSSSRSSDGSRSRHLARTGEEPRNSRNL
ncbi:MAG TPA: hypothetical protein VEX42_09100 [Microbacterium sp.]|nr:hypothetical protein [Microbacterium sp.]